MAEELVINWSWKELAELFYDSLVEYNEEIQKNTRRILCKISNNLSEHEIFEPLLEYKDYKWFGEECIVDLFMYTYEERRFTSQYLNIRKELLNEFPPYDINLFEEAGNAFELLYIKYVRKYIKRFKRLYDLCHDYIDCGRDEMCEFIYVVSGDDWYNISDDQFDKVISPVEEEQKCYPVKKAKELLENIKLMIKNNK
ncbi:MAG: hypothetical protein N2749_04895 [Clostridia bacterium]|nr:hypothetical protein [Clostridia bacterium]